MYRSLTSLVYLTDSAIRITAGQRGRSPSTKNCAPQATAVCGCGERQPTDVQWKVSARGSLLLDQGIPSASLFCLLLPNNEGPETGFSQHSHSSPAI
ncbi:hypothetical protein TNIN_151821 [Trichonephila inaurata madagascariensis]|uniref:Uncharacterized protein n=1 Tax=Trichonephila inaurata madagascariensis TaxID=2747483 RepID=A0A8X6WL83_9ARAC|nr:hypothetical protein TNIN_151821 [Trichonephila inaurata madagascariensis]